MNIRENGIDREWAFQIRLSIGVNTKTGYVSHNIEVPRLLDRQGPLRIDSRKVIEIAGYLINGKIGQMGVIRMIGRMKLKGAVCGGEISYDPDIWWVSTEL